MRDKKQALEAPNSQRCIMMFARASFHRPVTEAAVLRKFTRSFLRRPIYERKMSDVFSFSFNVRAWSLPISYSLPAQQNITRARSHLSRGFLSILFSGYIFALCIFIQTINFHLQSAVWHTIVKNCHVLFQNKIGLKINMQRVINKKIKIKNYTCNLVYMYNDKL